MNEYPTLASMEAALLYDSVSGEYISQKMNRIQEIIQDYDPTLELVWIPPKERTAEDTQPFAVVHHPSNGKASYIAMMLREDEVNEDLLVRLWTHDNKHNNVLTQLEAKEAAQKAIALKKQMDEEEQRRDLVAHIVKSPKVVYTHDRVRYK